MIRNKISTGARLALFLVWSGFVISIWILRRLLVAKANRARIAAGYSMLWSKVTLRLLGLKVTLEGTKPTNPFFLVTNHLGYLDIPLIASQLPCTFVAKSEVASWPLFGTLATLSGTLFIDRESMRDNKRVNDRIQKHFSSSGSLALFPEGTSTDGRKVAPFRSSLLCYPADRGMPVHCASIRYIAPQGCIKASESMCWWGDMTMLPHFIQLFSMAGMSAVIQFSSEPVRSFDRKELAQSLHQAVSTGLEKINRLPI